MFINNVQCPKCPRVLEIKEDEAAFYFEAAYVECECGFSLYGTDYNFDWALQGLVKEVMEIREKTNIDNGVLNG
jgi:hypothetical protein